MGSARAICLVSAEHNEWGGIGHSVRRLATLLSGHHDVTVIHSGFRGDAPAPKAIPGVREEVADVGGPLATVAFSCENHQRSAAVLEATERVYGSTGPDYLEVSDYCAHGLVPLQARRAGHPLLKDTLVGVKLAAAAELIALHDGVTNAEMRFVADMEREQLRLADRTIWRGGDVLDLYQRYYAGLDLPEAVLIRAPFPPPATPPCPRRRGRAEPLKLLFVGRLQRVKGALDLVEACMGLPCDDWELTMVGADTPTAPTGVSVQAAIEAVCGDDPRIRIEPPLPHEELQRRWADHDLLVVPSTFEVWGNVALEAMLAGLPVLATPVGGMAEIVDPGVTGWHAEDVGPVALRRALNEVLEDRERLERVRASGAVFERARELTDPKRVLEDYERLLEKGRRRPLDAMPAPAAEPLVTAIVPYHRSAAYVEEAVESALAQTHSNLDVLIVNDGSFEEDDAVLAGLLASPRVGVVTQLNQGEPAARNLGVLLARGEFVITLDADNALESEFVARTLDLLRREPDLAYVTSWLSYVDSNGTPMTGPTAYAPLGNRVLADESANWDGDALALFPRTLFSEVGYRFEPASAMQSDWELYRSLKDDRRFGAVIPERLARYRVHGDSLTKSHQGGFHSRSWEEALTRRRLRRTRWTAEIKV